MSKRIAITTTCLLGFLLASSAAEAACSFYASAWMKKAVGYCVDRSRPDLPFRKGEPVVYFMHGFFMNSREWYESDFSKVLDKLRKTETLPAFTVISFDTNPWSFHADHDGEHTGKGAFESWFVQEFIPFAEKRLGVCAERRCRNLSGVSMGGFGALNTAMHYPELFHAVGASEPAVFADNPYRRSDGEWRAYWKDKGIGETIGMEYVKLMKDIFITPSDFDDNDPVVLSSRWTNDKEFPKIFFDVTENDQFGFFDGHARLKAALDAKGLPYSSFLEPGGSHFDTKASAERFLRFLSGEIRNSVAQSSP